MRSKMERKKFEFKTKIPDGYGAVVAMCEFKGNIFVACQYAICVLTDDNKFKKLEFIEEKCSSTTTP